jgi:hypothetical protein
VIEMKRVTRQQFVTDEEAAEMELIEAQAKKDFPPATKFRVIGWHGMDEKLVTKLKAIGTLQEEDRFYYTGTLDSFAEQWKDKFMYHPECEGEPALIAVTQYGSFSQR